MKEQYKLVLGDSIILCNKLFELEVQLTFNTKREAKAYAKYLVKNYVGKKAYTPTHIQIIKSFKG